MGKRFGRWTVLGYAMPGQRRFVRAQCDCGAVHVRYLQSLLSGTSRQCDGCGRAEVLARRKQSAQARKLEGAA